MDTCLRLTNGVGPYQVFYFLLYFISGPSRIDISVKADLHGITLLYAMRLQQV